jgi:hypothetical protein
MQVMLAVLPGKRRVLREFRVCFPNARFLIGSSDYENIFQVQGILALGRCARPRPRLPEGARRRAAGGKAEALENDPQRVGSKGLSGIFATCNRVAPATDIRGTRRRSGGDAGPLQREFPPRARASPPPHAVESMRILRRIQPRIAWRLAGHLQNMTPIDRIGGLRCRRRR